LVSSRIVAGIPSRAVIVEALNEVFEDCSVLGGFSLALGCGFGALLLESGLLGWFLELGLDVWELGDALAGGHCVGSIQSVVLLCIGMLGNLKVVMAQAV
jgi:hypothetical protein